MVFRTAAPIDIVRGAGPPTIRRLRDTMGNRMSAEEGTRTVRDLGVLVVEDDAFTRRTVLKLLESLGTRRLWEAPDGVAALEFLRKRGHEVDVMLCDLEMPRMSGLDLLHALRTASGYAHSDIPVIMLTVHREADTVKRAISYGITGYLVKPVTRADLMKRLSAVTPRAR